MCSGWTVLASVHPWDVMKFIKGAPVTNWLKPRGPIIYSAFKDNGKSPRRGQGGVTGVRDEGEGCISPAGLWAHGTVDMSVMEKLKNDLHEPLVLQEMTCSLKVAVKKEYLLNSRGSHCRKAKLFKDAKLGRKHISHPGLSGLVWSERVPNKAMVHGSLVVLELPLVVP